MEEDQVEEGQVDICALALVHPSVLELLGLRLDGVHVRPDIRGLLRTEGGSDRAGCFLEVARGF